MIDGCAQPALHGAFAKGRLGALDSKFFSTWNGGSDYAKGEAGFEEKAREESRSGFGSRWVVSVDGGWRIRSGRADRRPADDVEPRTAPRHHARRRGNRGRQLGDVLCVRQRERRIASGPGPGSPRLRLPGLQRLPGLPRLQRLQRLRLRSGLRRWLLSVVGRLPHLLGRTAFRLR